MNKHNYGYIPDSADNRDFVYRAVQTPEQLPPSIDWRQFCSPVREQGHLGACTGFAIGSGLREFMLLKNLPQPPSVQPPQEGCFLRLLPKKWRAIFRDMEYTTLSPLFLYYQARVLEDTVNIDSGAEMRDGMRVLVNLGICSEVHHPYDITKFTEKPSLDDYVNAAGYKITSYSRVLGLAGIKSCLATGRGLALGFYVYESFESSDVATTGKMPMPRPGEVMLGGHAVFCCGYKDDPAWAGGGYLIIKNSWGSTWGDMGYFYMPYEYASNYSNVPDAWTATV